MDLRWKVHRLRAMSVLELGYRARQRARAWTESIGMHRTDVPAPRGRSGRAWVTPLPRNFEIGRYVAAADRILSGSYAIFALSDARIGFPPNWNTDPRSGTVAPLTFGKTIEYRDPRQVGKIKY